MSFGAQNRHLWVVVLAAGNGKRLAALTRGPDGRPVPKQYSHFAGRRTLLERALSRAQRLVPFTRTAVIVAEGHREFWAHMLSHLPPENIVAQLQDRGTAAGILLALQRVLVHDPQARLLFLPSDHFVHDEPPLTHCLIEAVSALREQSAKVILLGMPCDAVDEEYGWIVPSSFRGALREVAAFREKPARDEAEQLVRQGALLNTFMFAATSDALVALYERTLPDLLSRFEQTLGDALCPPRAEVENLYASLPNTDFSRDVLEKTIDRLLVFPATPCGWADLGTPARVARHRLLYGGPSRHGKGPAPTPTAQA
jgi:mannose-1-phosphate guanylyltransferase/mannose-6-phosphate isomerase